MIDMKKFSILHVIMILAAVKLVGLFFPAATAGGIYPMTGIMMTFGYSLAGQTIIPGNLLGILTILIPIALIAIWFIQAVPKKPLIALAAGIADFAVWILMYILFSSAKTLFGAPMQASISFGLILEVLLSIAIAVVAFLLMKKENDSASPSKTTAKAAPKTAVKTVVREVEKTLDNPPVKARICSSCGSELRGDAKFCAICGAKYVEPKPAAKKVCACCGRELEEKAIFCPGCGTKYVEPAAKKICACCGKELEEKAIFCPECGTKYVAPVLIVKKICTSCGEELKEDEKYCPICGKLY